MDQHRQAVIQKSIERTMNALEKNCMNAHFVKDKKDLLIFLPTLLCKEDVMVSGGSETLGECGVHDFLHEHYERYTDHPTICRENRHRECYDADIYFMSSNAITEDGFLYNVDGRGNRVSALAFGPKKVIIIAGYNKIVPTLEDAEERIRRIAAPANAIRIGRKTPCVKTGFCMDCQSPERICCHYSVQGRQQDPERITVILVGEELGY